MIIGYITFTYIILAVLNKSLNFKILKDVTERSALTGAMIFGIFIGATRAKDMRNAMLISFFIYFFLMLCLVPRLGNHGLWLAFTIFMIARSVTLMVLYPRIEKSITVNENNSPGRG